MFVERTLGSRFVFILDWLIQNGPIAAFLDVGCHSKHQPGWVIVETGAYIIIATLGQGLILMERATVLQLRSRYIQNTLAGAFGDHMNEAKQILIRITETHAAPNPAFE